MDEKEKKPVIKGQQKQVVRTKAVVNEAMLKTMNLGKIYWDKEVSDIRDIKDKPLILSYVEKINEVPKDGTGLWIYGGVGSGKSTIAAVIGKEAAAWAHSVYFVNIKTIREEKKNIGDDSPSFRERIQRMLDVTFLVIDDLDEDFLFDKWFGPSQLEYILKERARFFKPTIVTSSITDMKRDEVKALNEVIKENMIKIFVKGINLRDEIEEKRRAALLGNK